MIENESIKCRACGEISRFLTDWEFSGVNDSVFNYTAQFFECINCGLVFNGNITDQKLTAFYTDECSYFEKPHFDILAPANIEKYQCYKSIIASAGLTDTSISDVGCGRGGFLSWLIKNGWKSECNGVDVDLKSIPDRKSNGTGLTFREGNAVALPFADSTQSLLTYFHVFEHMVNIDALLAEAFRVLTFSGSVIIEVPDAERYKEFPIGTAYWLSIREHVNHFTTDALCNALNRNGFEVCSINKNILPTPEFKYPSLIIVAKKKISEIRKFLLDKNIIAQFVIQSKKELYDQAQKVSDFYSRFASVTFWGFSAELFSLLPVLKLSDMTLCDSSSIKQKCHYRGISVKDPVAVHKTGALIIAPYLFTDIIYKAAVEIGWPQKNIYCLK